jgi:hypothetical protein
MEYIYEARDIVPRTLCEEFIEKFENDSNKTPGTIGPGRIDCNIKKTTDLLIYPKDTWKGVYRQLEQYLAQSIKLYLNYLYRDVYNGNDFVFRNTFVEDNLNITGFQIQKYNIGDYFNWHVDDKFGEKRLLGYIIYLNSSDGCTEFLNGGKVKSETGKILLFPATWTYAHRGQIIKQSAKYIITGFIIERTI